MKVQEETLHYDEEYKPITPITPHHNHPNNTPTSQDFTIFQASMQVLGDAIPATMGLLFIFIAETINIIFIGRFNDATMIAGIGIGTLYINATGYVLGAGLMGGVDTLCSQAFGDRKYKMVGIYANVARVCIFLFFVIMGIPFTIFSRTCLLLIGQEPEVAQYASNFCYSMLPSVFFALQYNTSLRYLQSMNIFKPGMFITFFTVLLHPLWCYLFIYVLDFGVIGAGMSMSITQFLNLVSIHLYMHVKNPYPESYFFIDRNTFIMCFFTEYLKKAVPAAILFAADWIGFEILTLMSSYISSLSLAANVCLFNFITIIFMIPMGLSFASSALVGNCIGANNIKNAKIFTKAALLSGICIITSITVFVFIFEKQIPYLYTADSTIATLVTSLLKIYVCFSIVDCCQMILHGVIKGLGKQTIASVVALVILYPINIPLAYTFAFVWGYGLLGLWYSQLIAVFLLASSYSVIILSLDWEHVVMKTRVRLQNEDDLLMKRSGKIE
jgi:MATE family multidrug resistance protein